MRAETGGDWLELAERQEPLEQGLEALRARAEAGMRSRSLC